jgi:hypothetical protein
MGIPDEFGPAIVNSIPILVNLLTDHDRDVRSAGADTLAKLSVKGEKI